MSCPIDPSTTSILVIGSGTGATSTALHLARRGYKNVLMLDSHEFPSVISAGNDINEIKGFAPSTAYHEDEEAAVSRQVELEATRAWRNDHVFAPYYHETGYVIAASTPEHVKELYEEEQLTLERGFEPLNTAEDFRQTMPAGVLTALEAQRMGVKLLCGTPHGKVVSLVYRDGDVKGAVTADGVEHCSDRTILCAGANAPQLVDMKDQLRPTAWTLAHIQMTEEEMRLYNNLPVLFNVERGFFMEPDEESRELKICDEHPGYCNWVSPPSASGTVQGDEYMRGKVSVPFARHQVPLISELGIRQFFRETMPHLADRPFSFARICWCADTPDRAFLITPHPDYKSLTLGVGGSGHGFKAIPVVGRYIVDCMSGALDERMANAWGPRLLKGGTGLTCRVGWVAHIEFSILERSVKKSGPEFFPKHTHNVYGVNDECMADSYLPEPRRWVSKKEQSSTDVFRFCRPSGRSPLQCCTLPAAEQTQKASLQQACSCRSFLNFETHLTDPH